MVSLLPLENQDLQEFEDFPFQFTIPQIHKSTLPKNKEVFRGLDDYSPQNTGQKPSGSLFIKSRGNGPIEYVELFF